MKPDTSLTLSFGRQSIRFACDVSWRRWLFGFNWDSYTFGCPEGGETFIFCINLGPLSLIHSHFRLSHPYKGKRPTIDLSGGHGKAPKLVRLDGKVK